MWTQRKRDRLAGDVDMASDASSSDGTRSTPKPCAIRKADAKVPKASTTPVTPSHGLTRNQRKLMR